MNYSEDFLNVNLKGNTVIFSGKIEKSDYSSLSKFLEQVDQEVSGNLIKIDLKNLEYLNSSGIRCLATFFINSKKYFEIYINTDITWQNDSISTITLVKPERLEIIS